MSFTRRGGTSTKTVDGAASPHTFSGLTASLAGSLIVVPFGYNANGGGPPSITSATSNVGGTWGVFNGGATGDLFAGFVYCLSAPAGVTQVSITFVGSGASFSAGCIEEWTHTGTCTLDKTNSAAGASIPTPLNSGNITNTNTDDLMFGVGTSDDSGVGVWTVGGSGSWTKCCDSNDTSVHQAVVAAYQVASTAGPHNFTDSYSVETAAGGNAIISFQDSGGGGGGSSILLGQACL